MNQPLAIHGGAITAGEQTHESPTPGERLEFNSERAKQIAVEELDRWATDYPEAARALKALILDLVRTRQIVVDEPIMAALKRLEG